VSTPLLPTIAGILLLGIAAQLLARRLQIPSVLFLIFVGVVLGGEGLGIVTLETFGEGLSTVVGLSVAIIVFDGAFALRTDRLREASSTTSRLVTVGALVTFVGTTVAVWLLTDASWPLAALVGALLVATGPTVVTPILEVVEVREHVATALEGEGIINDVTAAIAAVVIYETLVLADEGIAVGLTAFVTRFSTGVGAGLLAAAVVYTLATSDISPGQSPQASRFLTLSGAIGSFALAELVAAEAGIAAAATAGIILGNADLPHRETMEEFGRDTTLLVLSFVFISLAALIDFEAILALGVGGAALVVVIALVIRPVAVALSTAGNERFTRPERLFMSAVAPRGIVPASVATLFAIELTLAGDAAAAQTLIGAVFVVIFATVVAEAGLARQIADALGVSPMRTIIVGGGRVGRTLAERLENRGEFVVVIEHDEANLRLAREAGFTVHAGDGTETTVLREAGIEDAKMVVAATQNDNDNLLICQLAASKFDIGKVYARVNDPDNVDAFESLDVTAIDAPTATALAIDNEIERPALAHWMNELGEGHDVQEIEVTAGDLVDKTIAELNAVLPDGCIVATVGRDGESHVPHADDTLQNGDSVTFIGDADAVREAVRRFHPHD
jgi:NhaP-type Na+/H+ or K+/H+ antiporter